MDLICDPPRCYCFTTIEGLPWYPEETAMGEKVDKFEADFLSDFPGRFIRGVKTLESQESGGEAGISGFQFPTVPYPGSSNPRWMGPAVNTNLTL
jgi:hypothetical protein